MALGLANPAALISDQCKVRRNAKPIKRTVARIESRGKESLLTRQLRGKPTLIRPKALVIEPLDKSDPNFYMISVANRRTTRDGRCK